MKTVDHLFHINNDVRRIKGILASGFKPSYAREQFSEYDILVPMISFSNILLRDVGEDEVLNYGSYGIAFTRQWGIDKGIHPVSYSYEKGIGDQALRDYFFLTLLLSHIDPYKSKLQTLSRMHERGIKGWVPFSKAISITNTAPEIMAILDVLSTNYSEPVADTARDYARAVRKATLPLIKLMKPYRVRNSAGKEFIAYNDREWRLIYDDLDFLVSGSPEYDKWANTPKPHYEDEAYRLRFEPTDIKALLVKEDAEVLDMFDYLKSLYGEPLIDELTASGALVVGTQQQLIASGF